MARTYLFPFDVITNHFKSVQMEMIDDVVN